MFTNDPFAQTEYAFRARSAKVKPEHGKPMMRDRWVKVKFTRKAMIGRAYWFDWNKVTAWQYCSGLDEPARDIIQLAELERLTEGQKAVDRAIDGLKRLFDPCPTCAGGRVANFEEVGHDQRGKSITVRHQCPECGL